VDQALHIGKWVLPQQERPVLPLPVWGPGQTLALAGALVGGRGQRAVRAQRAQAVRPTGKPRPVFWVSLALVVGGALIGWLAGGAPNEWNLPLLTEIAGRRRRRAVAGIPGGAAGPGDLLHLRLRGRSGARRHRLGAAGPA
jgi:ABC-type amino acid transport system permease subunit